MGPKIRFPNLVVREEMKGNDCFYSQAGLAPQCSAKKCVSAPEHHEILDHFFSQVVVYAVDLVLFEQGGKVGRQLL